MNEINLVACDMDGTFLRSDRTPHPDNIAAVAELQKSGITFCLASGRGISTMRPLLQQLNLTGPIVSSNGALVTNISGDIIFEAHLEDPQIQQIINFAESTSFHLNRYHRDSITFSQPGEFADMYAYRTGITPEFESYDQMRTQPATKLLLIGHHSRISAAQQELKQNPNLKSTAMIVSEPDYLEFLPGGINKGQGLKKLADHLGFPANQVAAIGDWLNDLEMLQWAKHSACVANATPEIKSIVQHQLPSNDDGGVATFLKTILQKKTEGIV